MGSILLMTGLLGIILFLILLFVNAILGNSRIPSAVCLFLCFLLFARGAIATVDTKRQAVAQSATRPENTWVPSTQDDQGPDQAGTTTPPTRQDAPLGDTAPSESEQNTTDQKPVGPTDTDQPEYGQQTDSFQNTQATTTPPTQSSTQPNRALSGNWGEDSTTDEITGPLARTAYWVSGGKSYHFSSNCPSLSRSTNIQTGTLQDALNAGKTDPCNNCANGS